MKFTATPLAGAYLIDMERIEDERGFFARSFCAAEFAENGLVAPVNQCSVSFNAQRATLRGLHFQSAPHDEEKLVRCTSGAIFDVIVDIRPRSRTLHHWWGAELSAGNRRAMYVPKGFAHGFVTLVDAAEVFYMISAPYTPGFSGGLRWNDPALGVVWPLQPRVLALRDAEYPLLVAPAK